ncbi:hypothetical protein SpCBS45565_g06751 [Spizellomyces sp. 'palustris']|nr:hypothetical protein SpCBS45565_g06751 [Spizellomyces sp. 'palustris']
MTTQRNIASSAPTDDVPVLPEYESHHLIEGLLEFALEDVGTKAWMKQHQVIERLNMQAHYNTQKMNEEFVTEGLILASKIKTIVHDLLLIDAWKTRILPLIQSKIERANTLNIYFIIYHEATVLNLLEIVLYNSAACEAGADALVDLVDYCAKKIAALGSWEDTPPIDEDHPLASAQTTLPLTTHLSSLSLIRHITTHLPSLPYTLTTRLLGKHDMICALVWVMERTPWKRRRREGKAWIVERFGEGGEWRKVVGEDVEGVIGWEAQTWLALYNLLLTDECRQKYQFNTHNHAIVLKLKPHLTATVLDQIPPLTSLLRYLEELSLFTPPEPGTTGTLLTGFVEEVPLIMEGILRNMDLEKTGESTLTRLVDDDEEIVKG